MIRMIYCQPLWSAVVEIIAAIAVWATLGALSARKSESVRAWKWVNAALFLIALCIIAYTTVLDRSVSQYELWLKPFSALRRAKEQPEMYRSMLMNILMFVPLGLTLSAALPEPGHVVRRMLCVIMIGFAVSVAIESVQYLYMLGTAEADDVICNTIGAALGASQIFVQKSLIKRMVSSGG